MFHYCRRTVSNEKFGSGVIAHDTSVYQGYYEDCG